MISIIVPVYNSSKVLSRCVESLLSQEYKNIEIILVNDGSIDGSDVICDELSQNYKNIKSIHKPNGGVSSARNVGIEASTGKYIMFCDSDDIVENNWCSELRYCAELHPDYLSICGIEKIWVGSNERKECQLMDSLAANVHVSSDGFFLYETSALLYLNSKWVLHSPTNKIYKSEIIKQNNIRFDENISNGEDAIFNFEYISKDTGKVAFVNKCLYTYLYSSQEGLSKNNELRGGVAVSLHYKKFNKLISDNVNINITESDVAEYYFNLFIQSVKAYTTDENMSVFLRLKKVIEITALPGYKECVKRIKSDLKIVKIARCRWVFVLYMILKG